ncbi:TonB-dependent siderophore receptor [Roseateles chitosanitabidus]|uniref:TonB-dependent siderophore receptor n=1 Tax=Roseateles chitosanitabidus TaxID=65048 RepID=UPI000A67D028|nr:TonB-dependent receptor [Roseateles chitosanitabidus]
MTPTSSSLPSSLPFPFDSAARLTPVGLAVLLLAGAAMAPEVRAQGAAAPTAAAPSATAQRDYRIAAGPLSVALARFAAASGVALSFDPALTRDLGTGGLQGAHTVASGFAALLSGSGLVAVASADGVYTLRRQGSTASTAAAGSTPAREADITLPPVRVVARAAPAPEEADRRYQPTPDASTLRTTASMLDIPQVVNVVSAQVIRDQRPRNLDDALYNVSGITQGNTLASTQDTIMKRGFGGNRDGSVMHNGMPLVQGRGMNAAAESVEVLKGPSSLLYGIMDPGGVINIVSKKPRLTARTTVSVLGSGYAGGKTGIGETLDTTGRIGAADPADAGTGLAYRLVVDQINEDYWRNFGTHRETLVAPSVAWYGRDTQAVLWVEYRNYLTPFDRGTALDPATKQPLPVPKTQRLDEPFNQMDGQSWLGQLSVDHQLGGGWAAHVNASVNRETYDANQLRVNGVNTRTGTLTRSNDGTWGALSTDNYATAYVDGKVRTGALTHELQFGADAEYRLIYRRDLLRQAVKTTFSYLNPVYGTELPSQTISASDSDQTDKLHNQSVFFQDALRLDDHWTLVGGLRYQHWTQEAGRGRPFKANTDTRGDKWLPRVGLVYAVNDVFSVYGSYSTSLKPQSTIAPLASGMVIDASVHPEQGKSVEVGAKLDLPGRVTGTVALFDIKKRNVLVSQYNDATKQTDWRTAGAARSRGLEFDLAGQIARGWEGIAAFAYVDAKTTEDPLYAGLRLWNVARQTASLSVVHDFGQVGPGKLRIGGGGRYIGKRPGDSANSFELPAYSVADAFATYETRAVGRPLKLQLNVKNLFDRNYYTSSVNTYNVSMGDARQVSLMATMDF